MANQAGAITSRNRQLNFRRGIIAARLRWAFQGVVHLTKTGWGHWHHRTWALDYFHQGRPLRLRMGRGREFLRYSGVAILYAPGTQYHEWYERGRSLEVNYIHFTASGEAETLLRRLTGRGGWCLVRDPERVIADRLRRISEEWRQQQPYFELTTHGVFIELLGCLAKSQPVEPHQRVSCLPVPPAKRRDLPGRVENFIRAHLTKPLHIADLARHVGLSVSALTHTYPTLAGESPYHTIQRLKLEAAKQLLLQEGLSLKEVAGRLSFSSEFHFSRLFKRLEGIAPQEYRRMLLKQPGGQGLLR